MNERGFSTVLLLALFPLLLTILLVLSSGYLVIRADGETRHVCRVALLQSQEEVAILLEDLMKLNKRASTLRKQRKVAETAARFPSAESKVIAETALAFIKAQQAQLAAEQKRILFQARAISRQSPYKTRSKILRALHGLRSISSPRRRGPDFEFKVQGGSFDVIATPVGSMTPNYSPSPLFSERQSMMVRWTYSIGDILPTWWLSFDPASSQLRLSADCGATLVKPRLGKRSLLWEAKLKMDK